MKTPHFLFVVIAIIPFLSANSQESKRDLAKPVSIITKDDLILHSNIPSVAELGNVIYDGEKTRNTSNISIRGLGGSIGIADGQALGAYINASRGADKDTSGNKSVNSSFAVGIQYYQELQVIENFNTYLNPYIHVGRSKYKYENNSNDGENKYNTLSGGLEAGMFVEVANNLIASPHVGYRYQLQYNVDNKDLKDRTGEFYIGVDANIILRNDQIVHDCKNDYQTTAGFLNENKFFFDIGSNLELSRGREKDDYLFFNGTEEEIATDTSGIGGFNLYGSLKTEVADGVFLGGIVSFDSRRYFDIEEKDNYSKSGSSLFGIEADIYPFIADGGWSSTVFGRVNASIGNISSTYSYTGGNTIENKSSQTNLGLFIGSTVAVTPRLALVGTFGVDMRTIKDSSSDIKRRNNSFGFNGGLSYGLK